MKVLLVDPPHRLFPGLRMWTPSFGLLQLAAYLEREGFEVQIIDATTLKRPWKDLASLVSTSKAEVIGITCSATCLSPEAIQAIHLCRRMSPASKIVAGGSHFTLLAEPILKEIHDLDYIVLGEGEIAFSELLKQLSSGGDGRGLKGVAYRENGGVVLNRSPSLIPNLDSLPLPAYHLIDLEQEAYYWHGMGRRAFGLSTSRGCGDRCAYCSETRFWEGVWRGRSGKKVVEEISYLYHRHGKSLFVFNENTFNWSRRRVEEFLEELGRSGLRIHFWFQSRVRDILRDEDLIPEMKRLGLYEVMLGIESIHPEVLDRYEKQQSREMAQRAIDILRRHDIMVMANVMFGDWDDSEETLKEIFRFVKRQSDFLVLTMTTPLPGTRYFEEAERLGRIREWDFGKYDFMHPVMDTKFLTAEEVQRLHQAYLKKYYTQPRILLGAFFSRNPFKRMAYRLILRYVWENATKRPWRQPNLEDLDPNDFSRRGP
ncbi:MAG: B12-binding domain-containing radical SAM protein [Desulfobacterota bacterium]|nr:B12-binding domain-containing radical SAM protein [Thermodesulfobacteriota bacterium]